MEIVLNIQPALDVRVSVVGGREEDGTAEYNFSVYDPAHADVILFEMRLEPLWFVNDLESALKHMLNKDNLPEITTEQKRFQPGDFYQHTLMRHAGHDAYPSGFSFTRALHQTLVDRSAQVAWLKNIYSSAIPQVPWEGDFAPQGKRTWDKYIAQEHPRVEWIPEVRRYRFAVVKEQH